MKSNRPLLSYVTATSLRAQIAAALSVAVIVGIAVGGSWYKWKSDWEAHLTSSYKSGISLFEIIQDLRAGGSLDEFNRHDDFQISIVQPEQLTTLNNTVNLRFPDVSDRRYETLFSILDFRNSQDFEGKRIPIRIFSPKLTYSLSTIPGSELSGLSERFGALVQTLASYCGSTLMFAEISDGNWLKVEGDKVWSCSAEPRDWRVIIFIIAGILFSTLLTMGMSAVDTLETLSKAIKARASEGRIAPIKTAGSPEVQAISNAVNHYFDREKDRLEQRAVLLSGISHDLGTPATRLKLRTALIDDAELRGKLEHDIDQITSMIESVLAYTRNEMNLEDPRRVSLYSIVQSVVDDYADVGAPVTIEPIEKAELERPGTIFQTGSTAATVNLSNQNRLLCSCRPNAIRRALSNLIDNALKYGRSAHVSLSATSEQVTITVQDEGGAVPAFDFEALIEPFKRGSNAAHREGIGLGLTIVSNIALSHGGTLAFETVNEGTRAILVLPRG